MPAFLIYIIYFFSGAFLWTFLEYILHRFLGHWKKGTSAFTQEHLRHHREAHYFAPATKKAAAAAVVFSANAVAVGFFAGWWQGFAFICGLGLMYFTYEAIHKRLHTHAPIGLYGKWLRKHHFYHHFKDPKKNHGVTTPLWDLVFRTNVDPEVVPVPRKFSLPWLIDVDGNILPDFAQDYSLR